MRELIPEAAVEAASKRIGPAVTARDVITILEAAAPHMLAEALARIERVEALASGWEARGEYDMEFSKTLPDEDIAMEILTNGAQMVENARHIRHALEAAK